MSCVTTRAYYIALDVHRVNLKLCEVLPCAWQTTSDMELKAAAI